MSAAEALHGAGKWPEARVLYERILAGDPGNARAMYFLGLLKAQEGDAGNAAALIERAVSRGFATAQVHVNLGVVYLGLDRLDDADRVLRTALALDGAMPSAYATLGVVRARMADAQGAVKLLARARELAPADVDVTNNLAGALRDLGELDDALALFAEALRLRPADAAIWSNLASAQAAARQWRPAIDSFRRAIALDDRAPGPWCGLSLALAETGEWEDAEGACREAVALQPAHPDGHLALARVLRLRNKCEEAEATLRGLLDRMPRHAKAWGQLAALQGSCLRLAEAEESYRSAVDADPASDAARFDLAHFLLGKGEYAEGFALFESRFRAVPGWFTRELRAVGMDEGDRRWRGEPLAGKHILVLGEQGFGDQIMMFRYLPLLKGRGARRVSLACAPELVRLARGIAGVDDVVALGDRLRPESVDVAVPALSLPHCFGSTVDTLPGPCAPRLASTSKERWAQRFASLDGMRVGLAWAGKSTRDDPLRRSLTLETLRPLFQVPGTSMVSLQKSEPGEARGDGMFAAGTADALDACADFLDTACVIAALDLVISVDTAVAHLAATLGVPTWLVLKTGGEWRWGALSATSPWYPSMRIFRQAPGATWDAVASDVALALRERTARSPGAAAQPAALRT